MENDRHDPKVDAPAAPAAPVDAPAAPAAPVDAPAAPAAPSKAPPAKEPIANHAIMREEPIPVKARELNAGARLELVPDPPKDPPPAGADAKKPGGPIAVVVVVAIVIVVIVGLSILVFKMLPPAPGDMKKAAT